jgi:hypothetical protein
MAEITVAGGLVLDVATRADLAEHHERLERLLPKPIRGAYRVLNEGTTAPAAVGSGPVAIDFQAPPQGRMWLLEWATMFVNTPQTGPFISVAAVASVLAIGPAKVNVPSGQLIDPTVPLQIIGTTIPVTINFPDKVIARGGQNVVIYLYGTGLAAGSTYIADLGLIDAEETQEMTIAV